jgi:hypothetical protein
MTKARRGVVAVQCLGAVGGEVECVVIKRAVSLEIWLSLNNISGPYKPTQPLFGVPPVQT